MYKKGDTIDGKYKVTDVCSNEGGMGTILHVTPIASTYTHPVVLKYCKAIDAESLARFRREVRYLYGFSGNTHVVQILDSNLGHDPPFFIMQYFPEGDLLKISTKIKSDVAFQELIFNKMLNCVNELHASGHRHRDIKPQNFLVEGDSIIISDLGLAKEIGAGTTFTMSYQSWGTYEYMPPEFHAGGFKAATFQSDIFMLGKTFYSLLTGQNPLYMTDTRIHPALFHVIQRCCDVIPENRYHSVADLRQDITLAYDVILGRAKGLGTARQMLSQIVSQLKSDGRYTADEINHFLDLLAKLSESERDNLIHDLPEEFFLILAQDPFTPILQNFMEQYEVFTRDAVGVFSYAETVAKNMKIIFDGSQNIKNRVKALEIAIEGAIWANRYAAMDTCEIMITNVSDDALGIPISSLVMKYKDSFISNIETSRCRNDAIINAIQAAKSTG